MKVLMITTYVTPANMRRELLASLRANGHEVVVVAPEPPSLMAAALAEIGAGYVRWNVNRTSIDPVGDVRSFVDLVQIIRDQAPDVVFIYQIKAVLLAPAAARIARIGRIVALVNGLGAVFDDRGFGLTWKAKVARAVYRGSLRLIDTIVFQNADDPEHLRAGRILQRDADVRIVPGSGVDLSRFVPVPAPATPTFTLVSRMLISKGIRDFVAAARLLRDAYPSVRWRLVGQLEAAGHPDGISREELDGWCREGLVEYQGFTADIAGVLAETSVFVLPSYYREGVPRTNLEAMAMGRPIVTTNSVGCRETAIDGETGFLVPPRDPAALAARLERYLVEPALVARHGAASRRLAERRFDIEHVNQLMREALVGASGRAAGA